MFLQGSIASGAAAGSAAGTGNPAPPIPTNAIEVCLKAQMRLLNKQGTDKYPAMQKARC